MKRASLALLLLSITALGCGDDDEGGRTLAKALSVVADGKATTLKYGVATPVGQTVYGFNGHATHAVVLSDTGIGCGSDFGAEQAPKGTFVAIFLSEMKQRETYGGSVLVEVKTGPGSHSASYGGGPQIAISDVTGDRVVGTIDLVDMDDSPDESTTIQGQFDVHRCPD